MKKKLFLAIGLLLIFAVNAKAQKDKPQEKKKTIDAYVGAGAGLDFGGFGARFEILPVPVVGVFVGMGTNFKGVGVNGGVSVKILPDEATTPTIIGMYGYNGSVKGNDYGLSAKNFYGPSLGVGCDAKVGKNEHKVSVGVFYPFRSAAFKQQAGPITFPFTFSIGFSFHLLAK